MVLHMVQYPLLIGFSYTALARQVQLCNLHKVHHPFLETCHLGYPCWRSLALGHQHSLFTPFKDCKGCVRARWNKAHGKLH